MTGTTKFSGLYDLIYLSNIIYYNKRKQYKELLSKFKLFDKGMVLTYLYRMENVVKEYFRAQNIDFGEFNIIVPD